jgi:protease-4
MTLGVLVLFLSVLGLVSALRIGHGAAPAVPDLAVLTLDFDADIPEKEQEATFADPFAFRRLSLLQTVEALDRAATDPRIKGIVSHIKNPSMGLADVQELRAALRRFRASGKFAYVYGTDYGEPGRGLGTYYLACAFEKIWMQPLGTLSIAGIGLETPYLKGLLDTIGVQAEFFQKKEFKTAFESLTRAEMSPENREMTARMVENIGEQMLSEIAADRGIGPESLRRAIDRGLLLGKEAIAFKLVDRIDYEDVLEAEIQKRLGLEDSDDLPLLTLEAYHAGHKAHTIEEHPAGTNVPVALIYVNGVISEDSSGSGESPLLMGQDNASAEDIAGAVGQAADDPGLPAIVLRIDSPGGSPGASETIRRALVRAKEKGKKVVVSMGNMAASGGYWIAAPADAIFASPATITGSIGVVGGKFNLAGLWEKTGVRWDTVRWGENAGFWSFNAPFSPAGAERMNATLDEVYAAFVDRVAKGRKLSPAQVESIAGGRVWTGNQARKIGLVDTLGGLDAALDHTARQIGLPGRQALEIRILPRPLTPLEHLLKALEEKGVHVLGPDLPLQTLATFLDRLTSPSGVLAIEPTPRFSAR